MDHDDTSNSDDHGFNTDSAASSRDNPGTNLDSTLSTLNDDPANSDPGPSSSQSRGATVPRGHLRCINCGLNISRIRRHVLEIAEVRDVIQRQRPQVQVSSDSLVCHSCWTTAWNYIRHRTSQNIPITDHGHVCISCGRSVLRIRAHSLQSESPQLNRIRDAVARQISPLELPPTARLCHNCWRRTDRATSDSTEQESISVSAPTESEDSYTPQERPPGSHNSDSILLPNYSRAAITQNQCFVPGCHEPNRLSVPNVLRVDLFRNYNYYVPPNCRICRSHIRTNNWDLILEQDTPIKMFSAEQIEDFASLLKDNMQMHLDFENIHNMPDHIVHYYLGFTKEQYEEILNSTPRLLNKHRGPFALAAYLMKLRTGDSDDRISSLLQVPRTTLERLMKMARELLHEDFVPVNLGINHLSRAEITQRNLLIPNGLFGGEGRPIIIADGTYIYIEKSSNYLYQKKTYSLHKYRNLVKPFLFVCTDGYIIDILGPYPATTSDADIINKEFHDEASPCRQYFQTGDVFILDRGFRDSLSLLQTCGYHVHVPLSPGQGETQLSTLDANKSRTVSMCRWVVEIVNGIFKTAFKIFRQNYFNRASTHLIVDFKIAGALINKFHTKVRDRDDAAQILQVVHRKMYTNNDLAEYVRVHNLNRARADFTNINVNTQNIIQFPILTESDLILIACGTYQIKQARSYYGEHTRANGSYQIEVCNNNRSSIMEGLSFGPNCLLIRARIASRHISSKIYFVYILISDNETGHTAIQQYCCNCIVGRRTVGCCAHVMTVIWYLGWARHQINISSPAGFLDDILIIYE